MNLADFLPMPISLDADILSAMLFRILSGTQDDHYIPATALHLLRGLAGLSEEDGGVAIELWAMDAQTEDCAN
jgi:hypothetical protein